VRLEDITRILRPLSVRVSNLIGRGVVRAADDAKKVQELQIDLLEGETRDEVERFQEYGFTSVPLDGAETVLVFVGGRRDHGLALGVEDRRYRIGNLASGEVAVYNHTGARIVFKANGDIELAPKAGQTVKIATPVEISGDVTVTGTLTASADVVGNGISLNSHTHRLTPANSPISVAGAVGTISGNTGGPS
jgi:phage gp45-like